MKYSVAAVLRKKLNDDKFLVVKRPLDDNEHPGLWGLPAISFSVPEKPEDAFRRIGEEKLGCKILPINFIGALFQERPYGKFILFLYEGIVIEGEPDVKKGYKGTIYVDQKWTNDYTILFPIAKKGSACALILLNYLGKIEEKDFIEKVTEEMLKG